MSSVVVSLFGTWWFLDWGEGDGVRIEGLDVGVKVVVCEVGLCVLGWWFDWGFLKGLKGLHFEVLIGSCVGGSVVEGLRGRWRWGEGHEGCCSGHSVLGSSY